MTLESLYKQKLEESISVYKQNMLAPLQTYAIPTVNCANIMDTIRLEKALSQRHAALKSTVIAPFKFDIVPIVEEHFRKKLQETNDAKLRIQQQFEQKKKDALDDHERKVQEVNAYNANLVNPFKEKHNELLAYNDKLEYVFKHYDISPLDIKISDDLTPKEFGVLIDKSLEVCAKYSDKQTSNLFDKIAKPLKGETNLQFTASYMLILLVASYIALPFLSIPIFYVMCKSIHNLYSDIDALRIAKSLMTQIDYQRFVSDDDRQSVDEIDISNMDSDMETELNNVKDYTQEYAEAKKVLEREIPAVAKRCVEVHTEVKQQYANLVKMYEDKLEQLRKEIDDYLKNLKPFPTVCSESVVMNRNFVLGKAEGKIDIRTEVPLKNIVFDSSDSVNAISAMKLYLLNCLLSVRVRKLSIDIYDPVNMCGDFTEFFHKESSTIIRPNASDLPTLLKEYRKIAQENIIKLDGATVDDFNTIAEKEDRVPITYHLLIILSDLKKVKEGEESERFKEFMAFSAKSGINVWLLDNVRYKDTIFVSRDAWSRPDALQYTKELGIEGMKTWLYSLEHFKDKGIGYASHFADKYIPRDKWWTYDTIKGIAMHYGLQDGDPTKGIPLFLGDSNVHALLGGATGAGKSAAINQMLISLITMYPPSELMLVYVDFKNVEAAKFTRGYMKDKKEWMDSGEEEELRKSGSYYSRLSRIPHLKIISGTTDGEYALSIFEYLMKEMARRQEIINKAGVTKLQVLRENLLEEYCNLKGKKCSWYEMRKDWDWYKANVYDVYGDLPRLLIVFDEFQVMFNPEFVDNRTIDAINGKITAITKLARAMGCHFWFTSQSMKGTMSKDTMGNFSLRGALRCDLDVSMELLGNKAAGTIIDKFGYMYTNDSAGMSETANRFWRVPFLDEKHLPDYIDTLNSMLDEYNEQHLFADFYDEKILVPSKQLDTWYSAYPGKFDEPDTFILGERATFSINKAPYTFSLTNDIGENVMCCAFDRSDMMNLALTFVDNLKKKDVTLLINCQDKDTYQLMCIDEILDERFISFSTPDQDVEEFISALEGMIEARKESTGPYKPVYVMLIQWERAPYVSVDSNFRVQDRFKAVMREAPVYGIHFIFISSDKLEMPRMIPQACKHRIGGLIVKDSFFFIETPKVEKLPSKDKDAGLFAIYEYGTTVAKFCIYQHVFTRVLKSREVVIE